MRVLVYGFSGHLCGGIETFLLNMNDFMSNKCVFDYIVLGDVCIHETQIRNKGGKIFKIPAPKQQPFSFFRRLCKVLKQQRSQCNVFYYNLNSMVNVIPAILAKRYGYKVILHAHNSGLQNNSFLYRLLHWLGKFILSGKSYIRWTNSQISSKFMFGKNVPAQIIYNAIDPDRFRFDKEKRQSVRKELASNAVVIGFIGRLEAPKNPLFLIDVFSRIQQMEPRAILWIIGEGSLQADVESKISELQMNSLTKMFGYRSDIPDLMQGMDLLLMPSLFEGLGIVLVEAQAAGLPCVTTKDTVPQIINVANTVKYVPLNESPDQWAKRCVELIGLTKSRSIKSTAFMDSLFNIQKEAVRVETLFLNI